MNRTYLGKLSESDPLYGYLRYDIQPRINGSTGKPNYRVFRLNGSNDVYLYEDKVTGFRSVGKFFRSSRKWDAEKAVARLTREYDNLCRMRDCGLSGYPHHVVQPLGRNASLNALLITEYCDGELFSDLILSVIRSGDTGRLYAKLSALAYFLSEFHNRTAVASGVDFNPECAYMGRLIDKLFEIGAMGWDERQEMNWLCGQWHNQPKMWEDRQVMVHGDATPDNFLFGDGLGVIALDLERARQADRVFDTGRIAGELKHFFMQATGNRHGAEPFIGHFLWEYSCHFPDRDAAFRSVCRRTPFYTGITLLRIARNGWIEPGYRRRLIDEAKECLRSI